jgi:hypothetical protein
MILQMLGLMKLAQAMADSTTAADTLRVNPITIQGVLSPNTGSAEAGTAGGSILSGVGDLSRGFAKRTQPTFAGSKPYRRTGTL